MGQHAPPKVFEKITCSTVMVPRLSEEPVGDIVIRSEFPEFSHCCFGRNAPLLLVSHCVNTRFRNVKIL
jgi:hypothetical protein